MFMSVKDAKHFLDDLVRAIILHHLIPYDPVNPVPKMEPIEFAEKYGKMPEGDFPIGGPEENSYFASLDPEAKRELLLHYAAEFYQMLEEDAASSAVAESELAMGISWIVMTIDYALGMGETFRDVRRFYGRAPLHGCAPTNTPVRRFPDTTTGDVVFGELVTEGFPSPSLQTAIAAGGAAVLAFPGVAQCGHSGVFTAKQQDL
jgi:hypothetical protein